MPAHKTKMQNQIVFFPFLMHSGAKFKDIDPNNYTKIGHPRLLVGESILLTIGNDVNT